MYYILLFVRNFNIFLFSAIICTYVAKSYITISKQWCETTCTLGNGGKTFLFQKFSNIFWPTQKVEDFHQCKNIPNRYILMCQKNYFLYLLLIQLFFIQIGTLRYNWKTRLIKKKKYEFFDSNINLLHLLYHNI